MTSTRRGDDMFFNARCLLELLQMMLDDMSWSDEWTRERVVVFAAKYDGVLSAMRPRLAMDVESSSLEALRAHVRDVEASLKRSREHVAWIVERFLPNHRDEDGDDVFWASLLT